MDIDAPPLAAQAAHAGHAGHNHLPLPEFSASFPLPFRVLFLIGLAIFLWATNLHVLHLLGLDTAYILDFRDPGEPFAEGAGVGVGADSAGARVGVDGGAGLDAEEYELGDRVESAVKRETLQLQAHTISRPDSAKLHGPVYRLFVLYSLAVGGGWVVFRLATRGEAEEMERMRGMVGVLMLAVGVAAVAPWRGVGERERAGLRR